MENIVVGIDIGSTKTVTAVGRLDKMGRFEVVGHGLSASGGVKKGAIVDVNSASSSVKSSVAQAESLSHFNIKSCYAVMPGIHVQVINNTAGLKLGNTPTQINSSHLEKLIYKCAKVDIQQGWQVLDVLPVQFIIDGCGMILNPEGMKGLILEIEAMVVIGRTTAVDNVIRTLSKAGLEIESVIPKALASASMILNREEKLLEWIMIDMGAAITEISYFKEGRLLFNGSVPAGGDQITNDISIALNIIPFEADRLKRELGLASCTLITHDQGINAKILNSGEKRQFMVSEIIEIIEARVNEIFALCRSSLHQAEVNISDKCKLVLVGDGIVYLDGANKLAQDVFGLETRTVTYKNTLSKGGAYTSAVGCIKYILENLKFREIACKASPSRKEQKAEKKNKITNFFRKLFDTLF